MFGFNFKKNKILGVDIGTSYLKVVELEERNGKPYLSNYAWMKIPDVTSSSGDVIQSSVSEYLKKIIKKANIDKGSSAYVAIPAFSGLITLIDFPDMPKNELEQAIKFEAHKYIPTSLDEVSISWEIVNEDADDSRKEEDKKNQILLVAASKSKVLTYGGTIKSAGLGLRGVEMEGISMVESLVGKDKGNFIIVDIGSHMCNIIYTERGVIKANRNLDAGGEDITSTIANSLGVSREKAEAMKISGQNLFGIESNLVFSSLDVIVGEINRILEVFSRQGNNSKIDALILSGGTANFSGLKEYFQEKTKIKTIVGNPFGRVGYDKRLSVAIEKTGNWFSVALGLALKGFNEKK